MAEVQIEPQSPPKTIRIPQLRPSSGSPQIHDLICVGFATLGLGLAVALQDTDFPQSSTLFLEQKTSFTSPAPSPPAPSARLTSSFAQDLATLRNPTSRYTYLNYLCENNALDAVVGENGSPFPDCAVFASYLAWAAQQLDGLVRYGKMVTEVRAVEVGLGKGMLLWAVTVRDVGTGKSEVLAARNVVFARGAEAVVATRQKRTTDGGEGLQTAVEAARSLCAETEVTIEDQLEGLAVQSARILKTCFEGETAFSRRAVL